MRWLSSSTSSEPRRRSLAGSCGATLVCVRVLHANCCCLYCDDGCAATCTPHTLTSCTRCWLALNDKCHGPSQSSVAHDECAACARRNSMRFACKLLNDANAVYMSGNGIQVDYEFSGVRFSIRLRQQV